MSSGDDCRERPPGLDLVANEARLRAILGNLPDVALILDAGGRYREILSMGEYLVAPPEQLLGRTIHEVLPRDAAERVQEVVDRALATGEVQEHEYSLQIRGEERRFLARVVSFPADAEPAVLWVARDITRLKREEEERRRLELRMQEAQRLESLGILAGGVAHDFNNLLVGVLANTAMVLDALPPGSELRSMLRDVEESARRAARLCQQMLAYAGRGTVARQRMDLNEIVPDIRQLLGASISKLAAVTFELSRRPLILDADATQLRQVLMNLVTNASEALGSGPGEIHIATGRRRFEVDELIDARPKRLPAGDYVYLEVRDTGCGMEAEVCARLFEPFFTTKFAGRGLGMASVLGIVRRHEGALQVDSAPGHGTRVRVLFPPLRDAARAPVVDRPTGMGTVLCIDDEEVVRNVLGRILDRDGFDVLLASDSRVGLRLLEERCAAIRVLVVDATMPGIGGRDIVVRARQLRPTLPILVISGHDPADVQRQFASFAVGVLHKPFTPAALSAAVTALCRGAAPPGGGEPGDGPARAQS